MIKMIFGVFKTMQAKIARSPTDKTVFMDRIAIFTECVKIRGEAVFCIRFFSGLSDSILLFILIEPKKRTMSVFAHFL